MEHRFIAHRRTPGNQAAIVFVHGFGGGASDTWGMFPEFIRNRAELAGWDVLSLGYSTNLRVDLVGLWSADPDIRRIAGLLATHAKLGELKDYGALAFVAHSMGGLAVQRALLDDAELRGRVRHVLCYGTPSGGLVKAWLGRLFKPQMRDMWTDSAFITGLRAEWTGQFAANGSKRHPFHLTLIAGERDEFVPPRSSQEPFGAADFPDVAKHVVPGNHIEMVKPERADNLSVAVLANTLIGRAAPAGPWNAARVAVEQGDFQRAIDELLPRETELDDAALVSLALALDGVGRGAEALALLERHQRSNTDAIGTLAGRIKRRWLVGRVAADAQRARDLYQQSYATAVTARDWPQAYYHGINVAFLDLVALPNRAAAEERARRVLQHCADAEPGELPKDAKWRLAAAGEAHLLLREFERARECYQAALAAPVRLSPREVESMFQQMMRVAEVVATEEEAQRLRELVRGPEAGQAGAAQ